MRRAYVGGDWGASANAVNMDDATAPGKSINWPSGIRPGDLAVLFWLMQSTSSPTGDPSGMSLVTSYDNSAGSQRYRFYQKVCTGTESGGLGLTVTALNKHSAVVNVYRGVKPVQPGDWSIRDETASVTSHPTPNLVSPVADASVLTVVGERSSSGTNLWNPPVGYTKRTDSDGGNTGGGMTSIALADDGLNVSRPQSQLVNPGSWVSANSWAEDNVTTWTLILRPLDFVGWGIPIA